MVNATKILLSEREKRNTDELKCGSADGDFCGGGNN